jgi:uncharacterized repeat protein (TIGR03806 family)
MTRTFLLVSFTLGGAAVLGAACGDDAATGGSGVGGAGAAPGAGGAGGCGTCPETVEVTPPPFGSPYETLEEWHLFADVANQVPAERVVPFGVISPLFSDYAHKWRFLYVPEGTTITYSDTGVWEFPVGAILVKTFAYLDDPADPAGGKNLLETRLLWREPSGWTPHTYVYDASDVTATRTVAGDLIMTTFTRPDGMPQTFNYRVPNTNDCKECHKGPDDAVRHLGPRTRQLDMDNDYGGTMTNQIDHLFAIGYLDKQPAPPAERVRLVDPGNAANDLTLRVRSYFDANCSHCHSADGAASTSALRLDYELTDPMTQPKANWGACVVPTSAGTSCPGLTIDVVPGDAASSVMACRVASTDLDEKMPSMGMLPHDEGVDLVTEWIDAMPVDPECPPQ